MENWLFKLQRNATKPCVLPHSDKISILSQSHEDWLDIEVTKLKIPIDHLINQQLYLRMQNWLFKLQRNATKRFLQPQSDKISILSQSHEDWWEIEVTKLKIPIGSLNKSATLPSDAKLVVQTSKECHQTLCTATQ